MAKYLKVYNGTVVRRGGREYKVFIAASSKVKAAQVAHESLYSFSQYWSEGGSEEDRLVALRNPYTQMGRPLDKPGAPLERLDD